MFAKKLPKTKRMQTGLQYSILPSASDNLRYTCLRFPAQRRLAEFPAIPRWLPW